MTVFATIDPNKPLGNLTVGEFTELVVEQLLATCPIADFTGIAPGHAIYGITINDVRFDLYLSSPVGMPPGKTVTHPLQGAPADRTYLGLFGTGEVRITLPVDAKRVDVYAANVGGSPLTVNFYDHSWALQYSQPLGAASQATCVTATGAALRSVQIQVNSAECLVWRVRYCAA